MLLLSRLLWVDVDDYTKYFRSTAKHICG